MALSDGLSARLTMRLTGMQYGAQDIVLFELQPKSGEILPPVTAGAHLDLFLPTGLTRQYSLLTTLCDGQRYVVGVKRDELGRGGSRWLHDSARIGQVLEVSAPRNLFGIEPGDEPVLLLAGGIGITPLYSMLKLLQESGRQVHLHYWCRSPDHALFVKELEGCADVTLHYSEIPGAPVLAFSEVLNRAGPTTQIYCCGPQRMISELEALSPMCGAQRIHVERFQAAQPLATSQEAFTVVLARSGREVEVLAGETILQVLLDAGEDVMYSCEQGICGACEVKVIDGAPIHCDSVLPADEHMRRKTMMICCSSNASNRLVLDI